MPWAPLALLLHTALAQDHAEAVRLSGEIEQLAQRELWPGVEHHWEALRAAGLEPSAGVWRSVARSAEARGDVVSAVERWRGLLAVESEDAEARERIAYWESTCGRVSLVATSNRSVALDVLMVPFDPSHRRAVAFAAEQAALGSFEGYLPHGDYVFAGRPFRVEPGVTVRVEVTSTRKRKAPPEGG